MPASAYFLRSYERDYEEHEPVALYRRSRLPLRLHGARGIQ